MKLMWTCVVVLVTLEIVSVVGDRCGLCYCSQDHVRIVCAGKGFENPPSLPEDAMRHCQGLGLQRNRIQLLKLDYLKDFENLKIVDISDQDVGNRCVFLDFNQRLQTFKVIGK